MVQASQRATLRGPTFIRLLARLTAVDVTPPNPSLPDRLSHWLDWNHALTLSSALDGPASVGVGDDGAGPLSAEALECSRVRDVLASANSEDGAWAGAGRRAGETGPGVPAGMDAALDYSVIRQWHRARQRAMQAATGRLRGRLRDLLARQSAGMARLAEVDAAMELALSPREQALLAACLACSSNTSNACGKLRRTRRTTRARTSLRRRQRPRRGWRCSARTCKACCSPNWMLRFQPVEGLLAALRTR